MKLLLMMLAFACLALAQDGPGVAGPKGPVGPSLASESKPEPKQQSLTKEQLFELRAARAEQREIQTRHQAQQAQESRAAQAEINEIRTRHQTLEAQELAPVLVEERELILPICKALGVPEDHMRECQPDLDYKDKDGKIVGRIFWNQPKKAEEKKPEDQPKK